VRIGPRVQLAARPKIFDIDGRDSRIKRPSNSNASDRCATPDCYSNGRGSGTDNGVRGNSNTLARLVVGRSLEDWLQQLPLDGRRQWSAGWLDTTISWLLSRGANSDALDDRIYPLRCLPSRQISIIAQAMRRCLPISLHNACGPWPA
jgi:hypothetical protein